MGECKIEGCHKPLVARGLCQTHYVRWWRHGSPNIITRNRRGYSTMHPQLYRIFWAMHNRCEKSNNPVYSHYGARGIKVCERWSGIYGLQNFIEDMGEPPKGYSLDRIDVDGDYCPENCRWADQYTQTTNTAVKRKYSKRPGVSYRPSQNRWIAHIKVKGKMYRKLTHTEEEAIKEREKFELKYIGRILY